VHKIFNDPTFYPGQAFRGSYTIRFQTQIMPGSSLTGAYPWSIRRIDLSGGDRVMISPTRALGPGEQRIYEVSYDLAENGPNVPSTPLTPALASAAGAPGINVSSGVPEIAGAVVKISGANVAVTTQADSSALLLRHYSADGTLIAA